MIGTEKIPQGKGILAANHASFLDPPVVAVASTEDLDFLARSSLFRSRFSKYFLEKLHAHPIRRTAQDIDVFRMVCDLLEEGKKVVVFPEGERSADGEIQSMKSGIAMLALRMKSPIIPVYIGGTFEAWSRHRKWPKFGSTIVCIFGDPIDPLQFEGLPKKQAQEMMMKAVYESVKKLSDGRK